MHHLLRFECVRFFVYIVEFPKPEMPVNNYTMVCYVRNSLEGGKIGGYYLSFHLGDLSVFNKDMRQF